MFPTKTTASKQNQPAPLPAADCLAKSRELDDKSVVAGRTVLEHCRIAGAVAEELLTRWSGCVCALFPEHSVVAPLLHDIGKACPTFQKKVRARMRDIAFPQLGEAADLEEGKWGGHSAVSAATLKALKAGDRLAEIAGFHHGRNYDDSRRASCAPFGGEPWENLREEMTRSLLGGRPFPKIVTDAQQLLVGGLTVLADWIASGDVFDDPAQDWKPLVRTGVDSAGFRTPRYRQGLTFEDIFSFPPNAMQKAFIETVRGPGVYVLEAPMGLGKTEAALYAAYKLLAAGQAGGLYFGLPTQLTSNKMHERVQAFLERILEPGFSRATLVHSGAQLKRYMDQDMGREAAPGGEWFDTSKKGILAPFAVGTLDQALMAAMRVRHASLRALGLAGKVVILDEVHTYDAYTGAILNRLVRLLREIGCTVIILSATLTGARKKELFTETGNLVNAYPAITAQISEDRPDETPVTPPLSRTVHLRLVQNDEEALEEALLRAEQGQQILWIENTVAAAQARYRLCAARASSMQAECGLLHSRYTPLIGKPMKAAGLPCTANRRLNGETWGAS